VRRTFRLTRLYWLLVALLVGIGIYTVALLGFRTQGVRAAVIFLLLVCWGSAGYLAWLLQHRIEVTEEGIARIGPGRRRFVRWEEMRSVRVVREWNFRERWTQWEITGPGGRRVMRFSNSIVTDGHGLAETIRRRLEGERGDRLEGRGDPA
jgi:hypothetical protein